MGGYIILRPGIWVLPAWKMQLSPSVSRLLGRRCKEDKVNKVLSRCQCCSGLAKIRCKTSSRLGARSSCGFSCVSQRQSPSVPFLQGPHAYTTALKGSPVAQVFCPSANKSRRKACEAPSFTLQCQAPSLSCSQPGRIAAHLVVTHLQITARSSPILKQF